MLNLRPFSKRRLCRNLRKYFREYCLSSSIHGMRYFGERPTYLERGWWFIVFIICLSSCAYTIFLVYQKWDSSPVIVSFATREKQIYEIPFPAVTICPETKTITSLYSHSKIVKKLIHIESLTDEEYKQFSYMNLFCKSFPGFLRSSMPQNMSFDNNFFTNEEFSNNVFNLTPNILNDMFDCEWMNKRHDCENLFDLILTDEGVCATFNMMDKSEIYHDSVYIQDIPFAHKKPPKNISWTLDKGYTEYDDIDTYPRRALFAGATNSLKFQVRDSGKNADLMCKLTLEGYRVTLHTPVRVPRPSQHYLRIPLNQVVVSGIKPIMVTTSETVQKFMPEKRECYFQSDINLQYFKQYTQRNCQLECLTKFTLEMCNCVAFFMPRLEETKICGPFKKRCMANAERSVQKSYLSNIKAMTSNKKSAFGNKTSNKYTTKTPHCKCLPLCTDLSYEVETSASSWDWSNLIKVVLYPNETFRNESLDRKESLSMFIIYFKTNQFVTSKRHELYGPTDFLANFGGLLGLFTGFSIISLMEIIYFLTVRIICNIRLFGNWSGNERDLEKNL